MDFFEIIRKPWEQPKAYGELVFWFVIFLIAAYAMADGLRTATMYIAEQAKEVAT